jgi:hypothetical protein
MLLVWGFFVNYDNIMTVKLTAQGNSYIALNLDNDIELQGDGMDLRIRYDDPKVWITDKQTQSIIFHDDISNLLNESNVPYIKSELKEFLGDFFFITDYGNTRLQITHFQKIDLSTSTTGSITFPFGAALNVKTLANTGNAYLDLLDISNYPQYKTPTTFTGGAITAILNSSGDWVASQTTSSNVGIVYVLDVSLNDYSFWSVSDLDGIIDSSDFNNQANNISYDNTGGNLSSDNVKDALDELSLNGGGGGISDAPNDGTQYGRQNESWTRPC